MHEAQRGLFMPPQAASAFKRGPYWTLYLTSSGNSVGLSFPHRSQSLICARCSVTCTSSLPARPLTKPNPFSFPRSGERYGKAIFAPGLRSWSGSLACSMQRKWAQCSRVSLAQPSDKPGKSARRQTHTASRRSMSGKRPRLAIIRVSSALV